jgi:hypothetical protein
VAGKVSGLAIGEVNTLDGFVDVLTMIIFTASAQLLQHAAVNDPQANQMQDARAVPLAI